MVDYPVLQWDCLIWTVIDHRVRTIHAIYASAFPNQLGNEISISALGPCRRVYSFV